MTRTRWLMIATVRTLWIGIAPYNVNDYVRYFYSSNTTFLNLSWSHNCYVQQKWRVLNLFRVSGSWSRSQHVQSEKQDISAVNQKACTFLPTGNTKLLPAFLLHVSKNGALWGPTRLKTKLLTSDWPWCPPSFIYSLMLVFSLSQG